MSAALDLGGYGAFLAAHGRYPVVVAGGASGIGEAAARRLAAIGCDLVILDRDADGLARVAAELPGVATHAIDLTDRPSIERVVTGFADGGGIAALVNCVGITGTTNIPAWSVDPAEFERVMGVNLGAAFALSQAVLPGMVERRFGRVLHVASIAGKEGNAGMAAYSASKAGLIGLVKSMAKDCAKNGVTVNALAPAVIETPLVAALPAATVDYMTAKIPMARCGTLDEAAAAIAWIVSPACGFSTGFTFDLSGGRATY